MSLICLLNNGDLAMKRSDPQAASTANGSNHNRICEGDAHDC